EGSRHAVFNGHLGQALGAFTGDVFEVRRAATNDRAEGDDRRVLVQLGDFLCHQRDFEGTRRADDGDVVFAHTMANQGVNSAAHQAFDNKAVEAADHQGKFSLGGDEGTFDGLQGHGLASLLLKNEGAAFRRRLWALFSGQVFYNFQVETGYRVELHGRTHQAHLAHAQIAQDLRAGAHRAVDRRRRRLLAVELGEQLDRKS